MTDWLKLWQFVKFDVEKASYDVMPIPLAQELRSKYPDFESVGLSVTRNVILAAGDSESLLKTGNYVEPDFLNMLSLNIVSGTPVRESMMSIRFCSLNRWPTLCLAPKTRSTN